MRPGMEKLSTQRLICSYFWLKRKTKWSSFPHLKKCYMDKKCLLPFAFQAGLSYLHPLSPRDCFATVSTCVVAVLVWWDLHVAQDAVYLPSLEVPSNILEVLASLRSSFPPSPRTLPPPPLWWCLLSFSPVWCGRWSKLHSLFSPPKCRLSQSILLPQPQRRK